ncbi:LysR substrate-binding domain-containing protein [Bradyrhizobium cenepequi]
MRGRSRWRGEELALDVPGRLTLDNDALMVEAALDGFGLILVSEWWVADHLADGRLRAVLEDWTPPFPGLRLYYPRHRHMTAGLRAFIDLLREEMRPGVARKDGGGRKTGQDPKPPTRSADIRR